MFKFKIIVPSIIFFIFLIFTSIIKNQTRIIEKNIYKINTKITLKEKDISESQLDFYFLTSPAQLEKIIKKQEQNNYLPIDNSKIFMSFYEYNNFQKKLSVFTNQNEKKTKKN
jgi:cell division protein FtsL